MIMQGFSHQKRKKISNTDDFIEKAVLIHDDKFSYDKTIYLRNRDKVEIICKEHGSFFQTPNAHLYNKQGCPKCGALKSVNSKRKSCEDFIEQANIVHDNFYCYDKSIYVRNCDQIIINCPIHGDFLQTPSDHLSGYGCSKCAKMKLSSLFRKSTQGFIDEASAIHSNNYCYDNVEYINAYTPISIICSLHGLFSQRPHDHLRGNGCPKCISRVSKGEEIWLDFMGVELEYRQYFANINNSKFYFDVFDPDTNTVYEFYGDYYHGNPNIYNGDDFNFTCKKTFGELYQNTLQREQIIKNANYNLITIWENEFLENKNV